MIDDYEWPEEYDKDVRVRINMKPYAKIFREIVQNDHNEAIAVWIKKLLVL